MWAAYSVPANGGAGITVAIVDAYDSPNAASDLAYFNTTFSLQQFGQVGPCAASASLAPTFKKVNQTGGSSYPRRDSGWEVEINLDTQWVHAIAPCANVLLVEANSSSNADLQTAVSYAMSKASIVSMSWGSNESARQAQSQLSFEKVFAPSNNPNNVTFVASSGDSGGIVISPSSSPNVIAVGGTQLVLSSGAYTETAWNGSGGGCSVVEAKSSLTVQTPFLTASGLTCATRGTPDVAMSGGGASAVAVYISKQNGWFQVYGTSLSSPMFAGVVAIGKNKNSGVAVAPSKLYGVATSPTSANYPYNYRDITLYYSGSAGTDPYKVLTGWDFVTGLGSPRVTDLVGPPGL